MKPIIGLLLLLLGAPSTAVAQTYTLEALRNLNHTEVSGDLNKDGIADIAIIAYPENEAKASTTDDEDEEGDCTHPILGIFKGQRGGTFVAWKQYDNILTCSPEETHIIDITVSITDRGTLTFTADHFMTMGSWSSNTYSYVYRFQNGDFYLIGEDYQTFMRNTGKAETYSYNYMTHRRQHTTFNMFDKKVKPRDTWTRIPNKPLHRLGDYGIGDDTIGFVEEY